MQQNKRTDCPKCGRPLQQFNGHIGYCAQHKWVSPPDFGFDAEADAQNRRDAELRERSRLEEEQKHAQAQQQIIRENHRKAVRMGFTVVTALCVVAAAVVFCFVRPNIQYRRAEEAFQAGEYKAAGDIYAALGNHQDSAVRKTLCEAMIDFQEGRGEDAAIKLAQLTDSSQVDLTKQLSKALIPMMENWQDTALTPHALLLLLEKAAVIDPEGTLNFSRLFAEGHAAMLDGTQYAAYTADVDADGNEELIALNPDYSITVYHMGADSNIRIAVDNNITAACAMTFGKDSRDSDSAIACFEEAYRLLPSKETRSALTAAYHTRSTEHENAGDLVSAIADARKAMEISGAVDDFTFFYDLNLRSCKNGNSPIDAIALWDAFATDASAQLSRFAAFERWQADSSQLHLAYAAELAATADAGCITELRIVKALGGDLTQAIADAQTHFGPGLVLAELRLMELDTAANANTVRKNMTQEVCTALREWKTLGLSPADIPALIWLADQQNINLTGLNREDIFEEAALAAVGNVRQSQFVNWNADAYPELLVLEEDGKLSLYGVDGTWHSLASVDTKMPGCSLRIMDKTTPLLLAVSKQENEMLVLTGSSTELTVLFQESDISRFAVNGESITFSRKLEGSIERSKNYIYSAVGTTSRPEETGIDWQQTDYPQPVDAAEAITRYFEARTYNITQEAQLLTAPAQSGIFQTQTLSALPAPNVPGIITASAYQKESGRELFEVTYSSGTQAIRTWVCVEDQGGWKVVGAAETYGPGMSAADVDYSAELVSLNEEFTNSLTEKGSRNTCRVLVPSAGRLHLVWQCGSKVSSRISHALILQRDSLTGESVFQYELTPNPNIQMSKDLFVPAGVYYLTIEARTADAMPYSATLSFTADTNVELESNDSAALATAIDLNTAYSGSLSDAKDTDFFSFTLDETSAVTVALGSSGNGSKSAAYSCAVYRGQNGSALTAIHIPGNAALTQTGNLYLSAGSYLVQVSKGSTFTNDPYTLTVSASQNGTMEAETNNTPETANTIPTNTDIHGSFGLEGDVDYFAFTLPEDAVVQPRFSFQPTDSSSRTYVLTLLDSQRNVLMKVNIGGKEPAKIITPIALTSGSYLVKVENPGFTAQDYTLHLVSMTADAVEKEPNTSAALGTELLTGVPCTGVITTPEDIDYYKLHFDAQTVTTLKFSFAQQNITAPTYLLSVEQGGKTLWKVSLNGDSGGTEQALQFAPGDYYLRVAPSTWLGAVYTICIE